MKIIDLQQKVLSLQAKIDSSDNSEKYTIHDKLTLLYRQLAKHPEETKAKEWHKIAIITWESTIDKLIENP